jgi:glutathione S-transferase
MTTTTTTRPHLILCELADASADGVESYSPFCLKVHRTLRALALPYERCAGRPDSFAEHNPAKQVPVLLVDGVPFADSTNILAELDRLTDGGLYVRRAGRVHPEERLYEELADVSLNGFLVAARWIDGANWPLVRDAYFADLPAPIRPTVAEKIREEIRGRLVARDVLRHGEEACWKRFESLVADLDARAPEQGFWLGDRLGGADVSLFGQLQSFRTRLTAQQRAIVEWHPRLRAYLDRVDRATMSGDLRLAA